MPLSRKLVLAIAIAACSRSPAPARVPSPTAEAQADTGGPRHARADVHFMSGMIPHHAQAVLIGGWAMDSARGASRAVLTFAERMVVSQKDEIALIEGWLRERHEAPLAHHMLMPGMLTAEQLARLNRARGAEFDRLFLTLMIEHHQGAITMVDQLLGTHGAAQDGLVFRFAADVHADQTAEIERMRRMLAALPSGGKSP